MHAFLVDNHPVYELCVLDTATRFLLNLDVIGIDDNLAVFILRYGPNSLHHHVCQVLLRLLSALTGHGRHSHLLEHHNIRQRDLLADLTYDLPGLLGCEAIAVSYYGWM